MGSPTNATISGGTQSHVLTINDDVNDKPSAQFFNSSGDAAGSEDVTEETGSYTVRVKLDKVSEKTVTIPYTVDFTSNTAIIASDNSDASSTAYPSDWKKWDGKFTPSENQLTESCLAVVATSTGFLFFTSIKHFSQASVIEHL